MSILQTFDLQGKVALVTGAARGLGRAIASGLADAGADLFLLDRVPCTDTRAAILQFGRNCHAKEVDLSGLTPAGADLIIRECCEKLDRIDILVNNAGIIRRGAALEFREEDWRSVLDINLNSVFFLSQAAARRFVEHGEGGKIINLASMLSFQGGLTVPSYTAAKSAVMGLTKALANEWAARGINVNAIAPGYLITEVTAGIRADPRRNQSILDRIPAGRWGHPKDIQGTVVFLASSAADYLHGSIIPIDGGWLAR